MSREVGFWFHLVTNPLSIGETLRAAVSPGANGASEAQGYHRGIKHMGGELSKAEWELCTGGDWRQPMT